MLKCVCGSYSPFQPIVSVVLIKLARAQVLYYCVGSSLFWQTLYHHLQHRLSEPQILVLILEHFHTIRVVLCCAKQYILSLSNYPSFPLFIQIQTIKLIHFLSRNRFYLSFKKDDSKRAEFFANRATNQTNEFLK